MAKYRIKVEALDPAEVLRDFALKLAGTPFAWPENEPEREDSEEGGTE